MQNKSYLYIYIFQIYIFLSFVVRYIRAAQCILCVISIIFHNKMKLEYKFTINIELHILDVAFMYIYMHLTLGIMHCKIQQLSLF